MFSAMPRLPEVAPVAFVEAARPIGHPGGEQARVPLRVERYSQASVIGATFGLQFLQQREVEQRVPARQTPAQESDTIAMKCVEGAALPLLPGRPAL